MNEENAVPSDTCVDAQKYDPNEWLISNFPTVTGVVNGIVTPSLRVLLHSTLGTIDASIPNKDQNRAVKHILRLAFDKAYIEILRRSYPRSDFASGPSYMLSPEANLGKAIDNGDLSQSKG